MLGELRVFPLHARRHRRKTWRPVYTPISIGRVLVEMIEPYHGRRGEVHFIDARNMGVLRDSTHRELTDDEVQKIADTYHAWRGERVESRIYEDDDEESEEKMEKLTAELSEQFRKSE